MVKLGHLGLEMSQLVQHAISRSNGLEMSQLLQININSIRLLKIVTNHKKSSKIMRIIVNPYKWRQNFLNP